MKALLWSLACVAGCSSGGGSAGGGGGSTPSADSTNGTCLAKTRQGVVDNCTEYAFTAAATADLIKQVKDACASEGNGDAPLVGTWAAGTCDRTAATGGCKFSGQTSAGVVVYYRTAAATVQKQCESTFTDGTRNIFVATP